ncbi:MAG: TadE family protein [Actinomycetota bacterium]
MRRASQDGSASAQLTIAVPALMFLIVVAVQFALWQHASAVTKAAAEEGVRAARVEGGSAADGEAEARGFLSQAGPSIVGAPGVSARRSFDEARVEVTGTAISLVPWLHLPVRAIAASPTEEYRGIPGVGP